MSHHKKHHGQPDKPDLPPDGNESQAAPSEQPQPAPSQSAAAAPQDIDKLRTERDDYLARLERVSADYVNYQKRIGRQIDESREWANADLIKNLLPVLDDMDRALEAARAEHQDENHPLLAGMKLVHQKAIETLGRYGLGRIEAEGKPFDPEKHQAVSQLPTADCPPHTVVKELRKGYTIKGRVARPSMVVVSTAPAAAKSQPEHQPSEGGSKE